ncbi:MAG: hypothetical protein R3C02_21255 [Planctomycetaceae bacterium]
MRVLSPVLMFLVTSVASGDDVTELVRYLPETANTLAIVRVSSILGTERAKAEHWYDKQEERFASGLAAVPPWVETLVIGSLVHPSVPEEVWAAAVVRRPTNVTIEAIAAHEGTTVEDLAGFPALRTRRNSYVVQPLPDILTAYRPAHRLEASQWARSVSNQESSEVSPYLREAAGQDGHVVFALDLKDLLDPKQVEQLLMQDERFASQRKLVTRLVPLLTGIRGITCSVAVGDSTEAVITIDFSADVGPSSLTVKTLFVSILDDLGAAIDEFADSEVSTGHHSVTLRCPLSDDSLRRILSLIVTPSSPYHAPPKPVAETSKTEPQPTPAADSRVATQKYVKAVNGMIDDLQRANRRAKDYFKTATWHDNFARKIMDLPRDGVSPEALDYAQSIASKFRALGASLRGQGVKINADQGTLTYDVNYTPGWASVNIWGGVGYGESAVNVTSNLREVREKQAAAIEQGADEREQIWLMIENERADMER